MDRLTAFLIRIGFLTTESVHYIGGADVLPAPMKGPEEQAALEAMEGGEAVPQEVLPEDPEASELAAYRRAEAAERTANARIRRQMERLSELMADAAGEHAQVSGELAALMQSVSADLAKMQTLFGKVEETFGRTEASMEELKKEIAE